MAAMTVQRPSPESDTRPRTPTDSGRQIRVVQQRQRGQVQQPGGDYAAAAPDFGDVGQIQVVLIVLGVPQRGGLGIGGPLPLAGVGMMEDVQPLRVGGHDAVLDPVVDHLDEVAGAGRPAMQVTVLGGAAGLLSTGRAGGRLDTRRERRKDRVETPDGRFVAANHQAVSTVHPPDPAAGPDIHVLNAACTKFGGPADVIVVVGVAAVDDHVVVFEERQEGAQRGINRHRRHHHPQGAGLTQFMHEVFERRCPDRPRLHECLDGLRMDVVNDALPSGAQQRRTMLFPIRPSPIMPNSMSKCLPDFEFRHFGQPATMALGAAESSGEKCLYQFPG